MSQNIYIDIGEEELYLAPKRGPWLALSRDEREEGLTIEEKIQNFLEDSGGYSTVADYMDESGKYSCNLYHSFKKAEQYSYGSGPIYRVKLTWERVR